MTKGKQTLKGEGGGVKVERDILSERKKWNNHRGADDLQETEKIPKKTVGEEEKRDIHGGVGVTTTGSWEGRRVGAIKGRLTEEGK